MVSLSYDRLVVPEDEEVSEASISTSQEHINEKTPLLSNGNSSRAINAWMNFKRIFQNPTNEGVFRDFFCETI